MLFKFNRRNHGGWERAEVKADDKTYLSEGFHIKDKAGRRVAIVHKDPKSKYIEVILDNEAYAESIGDFDEFKIKN